MKKIYLSLLLLTMQVCVFAQNADKQRYVNPIIPGFNPDPSICRVGNDYYLATSTFEYFPGVPIYHSRDLVHWKMIGHALHRASQLNLDSTECSGGIYAPTLRYNEGTFYMITTLIGGKKGEKKGNFIVTATNPEGPWSEPHFIAGAPGIDPSLLFDDNGKVYYSGNCTPPDKLFDKHRNIWVQEIDLTTWKLLGEKVDVLDGGEYYANGRLGSVSNYEGSHIYKKEGVYYLLISHGGTSQNHAVSIWKSNSVFGPYELNPANPILTHRDLPKDNYFTSTGHADLVQTQNGGWWMVYLAKRPYGGENHILGRETFMSPVDWSGTWPVVNPQGKAGRGELEHLKPDLSEYVFKTLLKDDFTGNELEPEWTFIRTPRSEWWSLTERKGFLRIKLRPEDISQIANPSFIGRRQEHINFSVVTKMEFRPANDSEEAGLVVERDRNNYFKFTIVSENGKAFVKIAKRNSPHTMDTLLAIMPLKQAIAYMQVSALGVNYTFSISDDNKTWIKLADNMDGSFLGTAGAGRFTGTFIGMYGSSNGKKTVSKADFDWFEYIGR